MQYLPIFSVNMSSSNCGINGLRYVDTEVYVELRICTKYVKNVVTFTMLQQYPLATCSSVEKQFKTVLLNCTFSMTILLLPFQSQQYISHNRQFQNYFIVLYCVAARMPLCNG